MVTADPMNPDLVALGLRLGEAVDKAGGRTAVSRASGVPRSSLDRYLAGKSEAPALTLARLAHACGISIDSLLGLSHEPAGTDHAPLIPVDLQYSTVPEGFVAVPYLEVRASAGGGRASLPAETVAASHFLFGEAWLRSLDVTASNAELLLAEGDSMYPTIQDGDMMLVDRGQSEVRNGKIYVLVIRGVVVVKRVSLLAFGDLMLISDNERYPSETVKRDEVSELSFQGRVAWYGRAI